MFAGTFIPYIFTSLLFLATLLLVVNKTSSSNVRIHLSLLCMLITETESVVRELVLKLLPVDGAANPTLQKNIHIHYPLFEVHCHPMPMVPLNPAAWRDLGRDFHDSAIIDAIIGIASYGARIGYEGRREGRRISKNLASVASYPEVLREDLIHQSNSGRLVAYGSFDSLPPCFYSSPLGLVSKPDGTMRRIHNLSHPPGGSVNDNIKPEYGEITYATIEDVITIVRQLGRGTIMVKRDLAEAFRQIPVSPMDTPLLGFSFEGEFFAEQFLPFGLRTAPYLFNLFAEVFHWILEKELRLHVSVLARVIHYLDDFLILLPPGSRWEPASHCFQAAAERLGLSIKESKNEEGNLVGFGGVEVDSDQMVIRIPAAKRKKGLSLLHPYLISNINSSVSLFELQQLTGFLNFITSVVPLGRAFLRRLYNMQLFFPSSQHARRRLSCDAHKDILWWNQLLGASGAIERNIALSSMARPSVFVWSDAAGLKGLGGYFLHHQQQSFAEIRIGEAFSSSLPRDIQRKQEHINTKEMRAVEQCLLCWGTNWRGMRAVLHIDNQAVVFGIRNRSIRGRTMDVLRRCLMLASHLDIDLEPLWIPTTSNQLADALSRFDERAIANIAPQLSSLLSHRSRGFLMSRELDWKE